MNRWSPAKVPGPATDSLGLVLLLVLRLCYSLVEYNFTMKSTLPPLPLECTVSVTLEAACSVPGCHWRATLIGAYDKMPSIKPVYADHLRFIHPGYVPCARPTRRPSVPVTPENLEEAKAQIARLVGE